MEISDIVESINGRYESALFFVMDIDEDYVYLVDGKGRTVEKPKKKKQRHVKFISQSDNETGEKIRSGLKIQNSEIRRALATFAAARGQNEGGL